MASYFSCCEAFLCVSNDEYCDSRKNLDRSFLDDDDEAMVETPQPHSPMAREQTKTLEEGKESMATAGDTDDLDKMLEEMDVDQDFDAFMAESKDEHDIAPQNAEEEVVDWDERLSRDEVFSPKYRVSMAETREIGILQEALGIDIGNGSRRSVLSLMGGKSKQKYTAEETNAWANIAQNSVLLKRGACTAQFDNDEETTTECELCLFTKGMAFFRLSADKPFLRPLSWENVSRIIPNADNDSIRIETGTDNTTIILENSISDWKVPIVSCLLRYIERNDTERTSNLGWQHSLIYTPGFSEAVSNDSVATQPFVVHDEHNQLTPLLYAVKLGHIQAAKSLLEDYSADPNQTDGEDGTVPLYWADSDEMKQLLLQFGAKDGQRGELFDSVDATQANVDQQRQQQRDAEAAKTAMQDNMKLINERGQKIEELGDTARELNENAAEFRDLSGQLKSKLKQRSARWGLF